MKNENTVTLKICPRCHKTYRGVPALSRADGQTLICPDCGALVKRYGKPVPVEPDTEHQPPQPGAYEAPAQPGPRERVWLDAAGKPHFKGALCFWLIVCAVFAGYLLFGFGCMLLIYHAQGFFLDALAAFPEFSDLTDVLNLMLESIGTYYAFYVAVPVLFAVKLFGIVWLLVSKRRLAFYIALGAGVLLTVTSLLFGGSVQALLYTLDMLLTFLLLRKDWRRLRP